MKRIAFAALLAALLVPAVASAQGAYRFELTPQVPYRWGGTISGDNNTLFNTDLKVDKGSGYGVTLDLPLSRNFQIELLAHNQSTNLRFDEGLFGGDVALADIDIAYYHVGILFQGGNSQVNPYFVASAGITRLAPDVPQASSEERFSMSLGGGVKVFFNENIGYDSGCYGDYCCDNCYDYGYNDTLSQGQASLGLIFAW
jgi:opacity protein-like surface antigen